MRTEKFLSNLNIRLVMVSENIMLKTISIVLLIVIVILAGLYLIKPSNNNCDTIRKNAMLKAEVVGAFVNLYNKTEMFFDYWVYNFGDEEANNIKVKCKLFDKSHNLLTSVTDNFGNLASNSAKFGEVYTRNVMEKDEQYISLCYIENCSNCEILYKKIPDLVRGYEFDYP